MMYRVEDFAMVETRAPVEGRPGTIGFAASLLPDMMGRKPLEVGDELASGMRRWKVSATGTFKSGRISAKLEGNHPLTRGLILRPDDEPISAAEFQACAVLLVRLARAFRSIDLERIREIALSGGSPAAVSVVKTCTFALALVNQGATDEELTAAAQELGIGDEV